LTRNYTGISCFPLVGISHDKLNALLTTVEEVLATAQANPVSREAAAASCARLFGTGAVVAFVPGRVAALCGVSSLSALPRVFAVRFWEKKAVAWLQLEPEGTMKPSPYNIVVPPALACAGEHALDAGASALLRLSLGTFPPDVPIETAAFAAQLLADKLLPGDPRPSWQGRVTAAADVAAVAELVAATAMAAREGAEAGEDPMEG
jgi:hypothetical protein